MNPIRLMCLLGVLFVCTPAAAELTPVPDDGEGQSLTFASGRVQRLADGTPVLQMKNGVRVILRGQDIQKSSVVAGVDGVLTPVNATTYSMQVKQVVFTLTKERYQGLEEVHASIIDVAGGDAARGRIAATQVALQEAAATIEHYAHLCDRIARCRDERALAKRIEDGTVDLRTLPAVLKSYRDDPLSIRP